jgi:hypothetical protein
MLQAKSKKLKNTNDPPTEQEVEDKTKVEDGSKVGV